MSTGPRLFVTLWFSLAIGSGAAFAQAKPPVKPKPDPWKRAHETWERYLPWEALGARVMGAEALANTRDPRALPLLEARYHSPKRPHPKLERYLLASALARFAEGTHGRQAAKGWLDKVKGGDPWLAYNAYQVMAAQGGSAEVAALAREERGSLLLRAAAIEALGRHGEPVICAQLTAELLAKKRLSRDRLAERVLIGACASAVLKLARRAPREVYAPAVESLIERLARKRTPQRITDLLTRHLAKLFGVDPEGATPDLWRLRLAQAPGEKEKEGAQQTRGTRTRKAAAKTQFMGITSEGQRVVYLIDMSDSMLLPLTSEEKETLRRPVTGGTSRERKRRRRKQIRWDRVHTRFDVVREFLRLSLRGLSRRMSYAVIGFGSRAQALGTTPKMTPAQPKYLAATLAELDKIKAGGTTATRKHGSLRGMTNLHAALRLGFQLTASGVLRSNDEHVHPEAFAGGCDTIFLLSDGTPTLWDYQGRGPLIDRPGYEIKARKYKYRYKDPETGEESEREINQPARTVPPRKVPQSMQGPYQRTQHFRADLERLNLFRKVQINVIGVGEYSKTWLDLVTNAGLGKLRLVGKGQSKEENAKKAAEKRRKKAEEKRKQAKEKQAAGGAEAARKKAEDLERQAKEARKMADEARKKADEAKKGQGGSSPRQGVPSCEGKPAETVRESFVFMSSTRLDHTALSAQREPGALLKTRARRGSPGLPGSWLPPS
ncbi:MAG: hypothetical protein JKY65_28670 [Planctomycetes bacterium]|nr:hypothetical protein [Planctomycetota bacterium]